MQKIRVFLIFALIFSVSVLADSLYIKSKYANLVNNPRKKKLIKKLDRGTRVEKISKKSKWYKIAVDGATGWVYKSKTSSREPSIDPSLEAQGGNLLAGEELAAGSGLRGLSPLGQKFAQSRAITTRHRKFMDYHQSYITITSGKVDIKSKVTEQGIKVVKITSKDLDSFLEEGKLGEYSDAPDIE